MISKHINYNMFMLEYNVGLKHGMLVWLTAGGVFFYYRKNRAIHKIQFYFANNIYGACFVTILFTNKT